MSSIVEYASVSERLKRKAEQHHNSVEWYADSERVVLWIPSSSKEGKRYAVVVKRSGSIVKPCNCIAFKQGKKCWHMYTAYSYWRGLKNTPLYPVVGQGDRVKYVGDEAKEYFEETLAYSWGLKEKSLREQVESREELIGEELDLTSLSRALQVLEEFIGGLIE
ncbi:MAG: hypothetical protein DRJ37_06410 [Thermoprotei archaeon]|nr:MAG: hypothetical protein DRJ37_06410 [Thermoprotei archaeon]